MSTLFISHSSADGDEARKLQAALEEEHFKHFLDFDAEAGIQAGDSWERTLYTKLRACQAVVALASDTYLASKWCFAEIALARMEGKQLFVLQIDPWGKDTEMPSILTEEQFIDLRASALDEAGANAKREEGYRRLKNGFKNKGIVPDERPDDWKAGESPYPGLRAFEERDAPIFFGRDKEIREGIELLNRVRRQGHPPMVMVLGSSGSGKSSLARAGIVPRLKRDKENWLVVGPFRPGARPGRALAEALADAFRSAGEPRAWQDIQERLGLTDEVVGTGDEEAAAPPAEARPSPRERLRAALAAMEDVLTTAADEQVARSVGLLKDYLAAAPDETGIGRARPSAGDDDNPLAALTAELRRARTDSWIRKLESEGLDEEELESERQLAKRAEDARVVLLIDQFEELLGHEKEGDDHPANRFLAVLKQGIEGDKEGNGGDDNPPLALGTMRSDFLGLLQRSGPLRGVGFKSLSVGPMSTAGMRDVIEKPAELGLIKLEDGFTNRLVDDTGSGDALPLLAFTLKTMWDRFQDRQQFDARGYEEIGELEGAIAQVADETLETALATVEEGARKDSERELRIAFLGLARPAAEGGGWARQPASLEEMPERVRPMIDRFLKERLLVPGPDDTVEVAHEALFRRWETLKGWLEASREGLHLRGEIEGVAKKRQEAAEDAQEEYLWGGSRLARARALLDRGVPRLSEPAIAFIVASEAKEKRDEEREEAEHREKLEQARRLAEEQKKSAEQARQRADDQARFARKTLYGLAVVVVLFFAAVWAAWAAYRAQVRAQDQSRLAVASEWLKKDPTRAALVLLELRKPEEAPRAVQLMSDVLGQPLALVELRGHTDSVSDAAFSRSGDRLVTSSEDGTVRVWNRDGTPFAGPGGQPTVLRHKDTVNTAVFSPDGAKILTACADQKAWLWSFDGTGDPTPLEGHTDNVTAAAFNTSGDRVVTASDDGTAKVWTVGGSLLLVLAHEEKANKKPEVNDAVFNPAGDRIATATHLGWVTVWDATSGEKLGEHRAHNQSILSVAFNPLSTAGNGGPESELIVTASRDRTARVWQVEDAGTRDEQGSASATDVELTRLHELEPHDDEVYSAAFSPATGGPSQGWIVTASKDSNLRIWTGGKAVEARGEPVRLKHFGEINRVAFNTEGDRLITASKDGTARIWSADLAQQPVVLPHSTITNARFGSAQDRIFTGSAQAGFKEWLTTAEGREPERSVLFRVRTQGEDGEDSVLAGYYDWILSVDFSASGDQIVTGAEDRSARLWRADGTPKMTTGDSPEPILFLHPEEVVSVAFSPNADRVATASGGIARIWPSAGLPDTPGETGDWPIELPHSGKVNSVAFSPDADGKQLITSSLGEAWLWAADGTKAPLKIAHREGSQAEVLSAAFSPTGDRIVMTSDDSSASIWNADGSGSPIRLVQHERPVITAVFSADGRQVVTGSRDKTARVWNADGTGEPLVLGKHKGDVASAVFDRRGNQVLTVSNQDDARIWELSRSTLAARIRAATSVCLDASFRKSILLEEETSASETFERCRECLHRFLVVEDDADAYRGCFQPRF